MCHENNTTNMVKHLEINVSGTSTISHNAERAIVTIHISSSGPSQSQVSANVINTANSLQESLKTLSPKDSDGQPAPGAAVTSWSMAAYNTSYFTVWLDASQRNADGSLKSEMNYTASTTFTVKFADFKVLGGVCADLAEIPHVLIQGISWVLTDETKATLVTQSRTLAVEDAVAKARDFAAAVGHSTVRAVEINSDNVEARGFGGFGGGGPTRSRAPLGQGKDESDRLNFEPQKCELSCSVRVKFEAE